MALSDLLKIASAASMFIPGAQVATPFLSAASMGANMFENKTSPTNSPTRIGTRPTAASLLTPATNVVNNELAKINASYSNPWMERSALLKAGMGSLGSNVGSYDPLASISTNTKINSINPKNSPNYVNTPSLNSYVNAGIEKANSYNPEYNSYSLGDPELDSDTPEYKVNEGSLSKTLKNVDTLNKVSTGISTVSAVGTLLNEAFSKPPSFAPVSVSPTVNLDKNTSAYENSAISMADKSYNSGLSFMVNRGINPTVASSIAMGGRNNMLSQTLANAEAIRKESMNRESAINAEIMARNAAARNQYNQFKEATLGEYNKMSGQNIGSALSTLVQLPASYGGSLMGAELFKKEILS